MVEIVENNNFCFYNFNFVNNRLEKIVNNWFKSPLSLILKFQFPDLIQDFSLNL